MYDMDMYEYGMCDLCSALDLPSEESYPLGQELAPPCAERYDCLLHLDTDDTNEILDELAARGWGIEAGLDAAFCHRECLTC